MSKTNTDKANGKQKICYEVLGIVQRAPSSVHGYNRSPVVKVCTIQGRLKEANDRTFIISIALRASGLVEVYSDFELAEFFNMVFTTKERLFCVDIESDDESVYFRFLKLDSDKAKQ